MSRASFRRSLRLRVPVLLRHVGQPHERHMGGPGRSWAASQRHDGYGAEKDGGNCAREGGSPKYPGDRFGATGQKWRGVERVEGIVWPQVSIVVRGGTKSCSNEDEQYEWMVFAEAFGWASS